MSNLPYSISIYGSDPREINDREDCYGAIDFDDLELLRAAWDDLAAHFPIDDLKRTTHVMMAHNRYNDGRLVDMRPIALRRLKPDGDFVVDAWGSHPDEGKDDCIIGEDMSEARARALISSSEALASWAGANWRWITHVVLGRNVFSNGRWAIEPVETRQVKADWEIEAIRRRNEREAAEGDAEWQRESAMQAGMAFGCDGYNDEMGY